jgi:hypothetical protein
MYQREGKEEEERKKRAEEDEEQKFDITSLLADKKYRKGKYG